MLKSDVARVPSLILGSIRFENVVGDLSRQDKSLDAKGGLSGNIGGEIWRRFTLTLDYKHNRVFLAPNALFDKPFDTASTGVVINRQPGETDVLDVVPDSPGARARIAVGDTVLTVEGKSLADISAWESNELLKQPAGTSVLLTLKSADGTQREITLILRDLI